MMTFEWPYLLASLGVLPVLLLLYVLAQRRRRAYTVRFTNLALLREVAGRGPGFRRHVPPLLFLAGMAALLTGLARPYAAIMLPRDLAAVVLVIDVSGSMSNRDMRPTRLDAAKQAALTFVDSLPRTVPVGLVAFSSSAEVRAPVTSDPDAARRAINGLSTEGRTAIGDGLNAALDALDRGVPNRGAGQGPRLVVLLSDGRQTERGVTPEKAAERAQEEGVIVHTVGVGRRAVESGVSESISDLVDEPTLRHVAEETGGQYFYVTEADELQRVYAGIGSQAYWVEERVEITAVLTAVGACFLLIAGILSLRWFQHLP